MQRRRSNGILQLSERAALHLLTQRDDVFPDYHEAAFTAALSSVARIVERQTISAAGRQLFLYERA